MILFVDASVVVSIIAREEDAHDLAGSVLDGTERLWSAVTRWEAISGLCSTYRFDPADARQAVDDFGKDYDLRLVSVGEPEEYQAFEAYRRFGKGRHSARLNLGDCFAYACTKTNHARLLYKGDDFAKTDLRLSPDA